MATLYRLSKVSFLRVLDAPQCEKSAKSIKFHYSDVLADGNTLATDSLQVVFFLNFFLKSYNTDNKKKKTNRDRRITVSCG